MQAVLKKLFINFNQILYRIFLKRIIFLFNSELMHDLFTLVGEIIGKVKPLRIFTHKLFKYQSKKLLQEISAIKFGSPIGLAAGFDYQARLYKILPQVGFGFGTIGTITNKPYQGNPKPRLGRLVKSKSLLVNKGFKNQGIDLILKKLRKTKFEYPVGISIGKTNSTKPMTQQQAVDDIVEAFKKTEKAKIPFSYYELNISCPNLYGTVSFYPPENLKELLAVVTSLKLKKPLFIKMPIEKNEEEILAMLKVIVSFPVNGIIIGNLQKNRKDPSLKQNEVAKYKIGNFSGKPTEKRSNELIKLAYNKFGGKLIIIGCGGVFSGKDAYKKIRLGASLVQLITGLIFEGPLLASQINLELDDLLKKDGFNHISQAIGIDA
jgi:dihydroorotate dehydrogenase subfamily 2